MTKITGFSVRDVRFPTSEHLDGSDAMNPDPDYSAAVVILETDHPDGHSGHGMAFTIGRGNQLCCLAIEAVAEKVVGLTLEEITSDMAGYWRLLTGDSQLRWVGPEKGSVHMATAAVVNATWDLWGKVRGLPVWRLVCELTPREQVGLIDFRYMTDALTPDEALEILERNEPTREQRIQQMLNDGFPTYTTSAGWLGYPDDKLRRLCQEMTSRGWSHFKIKVGRSLEDDIRRCRIVREEIGPDRKLMLDANQVWDVPDAIAWMEPLAEFDPWFIEEPTSPDDILGYAAIARAVDPIKVAGGEACQNRVTFKQLMQSGGLGVCQIDSCRLGGVNEVMAVQLLAAKFGIPVCPHAGGVGLCEHVQHLALIDYICIGASLENRLAEYSDHLHEHFVYPLEMRDGCYVPPESPGYSTEMKPESLDEYEFPSGSAWN
ncbi:MAG: fuconate dehydratase [Planctomycetaceae bacterium]|jgi:L-fuconate dehydratase|nr:fuconate dehydratase [Planctomycetaceae bacterium]|tara:strand:+ start:4248 stop:5543 length:1296 start_codon:yes stop_codon:yes gene_type:complete